MAAMRCTQTRRGEHPPLCYKAIIFSCLLSDCLLLLPALCCFHLDSVACFWCMCLPLVVSTCCVLSLLPVYSVPLMSFILYFVLFCPKIQQLHWFLCNKNKYKVLLLLLCAHSQRRSLKVLLPVPTAVAFGTKVLTRELTPGFVLFHVTCYPD